ncbi:MAG: hypothetical protein Q8K00_06340 [Syntrophales bacterium]|nr:hypothetical protein [Syntrophales bacterium]
MRKPHLMRRLHVFMLEALFDTLDQLVRADQVSDQAKSFLCILSARDMTVSETMKQLSLAHRLTFRSNYVHPALKMGLVEMTAITELTTTLSKG